MKLKISENEMNQISSQHEEIDSRLYNFLLRRFNKNEQKLGGDWGEFEPLRVIQYSFDGLSDGSFTSYHTKKEMEKRIVDMLYENDIIDFWPYDLDEKNPERIKLIKTIRMFLKFVLKN